jgi:hypothetical protein
MALSPVPGCLIRVGTLSPIIGGGGRRIGLFNPVGTSYEYHACRPFCPVAATFSMLWFFRRRASVTGQPGPAAKSFPALKVFSGGARYETGQCRLPGLAI